MSLQKHIEYLVGLAAINTNETKLIADIITELFQAEINII
jgi:hypothetical protein